MHSSTSNSDLRQRAWTVGVCLALVLLLCNALLVAVFHRRGFQALAVESLTTETKLLALGSSRVIFGFDPRAYPVPSVGLAANYLDLKQAARLYAVHAAKLSGLRVVLIEFDTATLRYDTDAMNPYGLADLGLSTLPTADDWLKSPNRALHKLLAPVFNWRLTPAFYALEARTADGIEPVAAVPGHIPSPVSLAFPDFYAENELRSTKAELAAAPASIFEANLASAAILVQALRARGVRPVLLRFPHEPSLRAIYPPQWQDFVARAYAELNRRVGGEALVFWDLSDDARFLTQHFRDPDHLNQAGATLLGELLKPRLMPLLK